jgi:hypothetical protein
LSIGTSGASVSVSVSVSVFVGVDSIPVVVILPPSLFPVQPANASDPSVAVEPRNARRVLPSDVSSVGFIAPSGPTNHS